MTKQVLVTGFLIIAALCIGCERESVEITDPATLFQNELDALREEYGFPGATAAYALADGTTGVVASGLADIETGAPMLPSSRMLAASIGKTFVSATILGLAQDGKLDLDDMAASLLADRPWFSRLPNAENMTIRHLLTHRSGIGNHVDMPEFAAAFASRWDQEQKPFQPDQLVDFVLDQPPLFVAGEGWAYTDTGYILLGVIIEEVSGRSYYEEVTDRLLTPLSLTLTSPSDRRDLPGLAAGYMAKDNRFQLPAKTLREDGSMAWHPAVEWTGGGLVSNSHDLVVWAKALFEGEAMDGPYLDDLLKGEPISSDAPNVRFGAGVAIRDSGPIGAWYSHGGWIPGYSSSLRYYPDYRAAIAFQINTDIGIVDDSTELYADMAARLEQVIATVTGD